MFANYVEVNLAKMYTGKKEENRKTSSRKGNAAQTGSDVDAVGGDEVVL